jgi:hypothetical protein
MFGDNVCIKFFSNIISKHLLSTLQQGEGDGRRSEQSLTHGIACLSEELMKTLGKEDVASVKVIQQWEKPWRDKLKFNCDGTFNQLTGDGGWGFIIRDHDGDMVSFAEKDKIMRVIDAFQAKAVACRHGVN